MDATLRLIPLLCPQCSTPVPAETDEAAWVCAQCGQGMALDPQRGLLTIPVAYGVGIPPAGGGKPYWVCDGRVSLSRSAYRTNSGSQRDAEQFWSAPRRFFIPAFATQTETLLNTAVRMLTDPPQMQPGPLAPFEPVRLSIADIQPVAEFIVMAVEAARKDALKNIDFNLELSAPALWIFP